MRVSRTLRLAALAAASGTALATLAIAPAATAAPVFTDAQTVLDPFAGGYSYVGTGGSGTCGYTPTGGAEPDVPVVENGPAASATTSGSTTFTSSAVPGDTATGSGSASGTGKVTSAGGNLATMDLSVSSNAQLNNALGTSANCVREAYAGIDLDFEFTVTQPGFLTLNTKNTGNVYGEVYVYHYVAGSPDEPYVDNYGNGLKFNATTKVYLPAGTYRGYFEGEAYRYSQSSYAVAGTTTAHGEFHVAGSQTEAVSGKGKKYVTFAGARSCAAHTLGASVTSKKHRADQVKQVTFFVNDAKVKKIKTPDKGDTANLVIADDVTADVRAEVKLFPRKKGKPGKVVEVSASYEACS
jgi:hypothetical protein